MDEIINQKSEESKDHMLDLLAREGARKMLTEALEEEVTEFLERRRHVREKLVAKGYRNGMRKRKVTLMGMSLPIDIQK